MILPMWIGTVTIFRVTGVIQWMRSLHLGVRIIITPNEVRVLAGPCPEQVLEVGRDRRVWQLYSRVGIPSPEDVGVEVAERTERLLAFRRQSPVAHGLRGEQEGNDSSKVRDWIARIIHPGRIAKFPAEQPGRLVAGREADRCPGRLRLSKNVLAYRRKVFVKGLLR